jgi:nitrogen-specific signal transduction histidine kinase
MESAYENKGEHDLRLLQLRFIGKILAGFTHESKNYIAIVKESAGLIGDMIQLGKNSGDEPDTYLEIIHSIEEQIERATNLFRYLNRFSHRMDTELCTFNVNETLEELIALITRFANQKKISLEKDFQQDIPSINNNPSLLQLLIFHFLEGQLTGLAKDSSIMLKTSVLNRSVAVQIITKGNYLETVTEKGPETDTIHDYIINKLGGAIVRDNDLIIITLPVSLS